MQWRPSRCVRPARSERERERAFQELFSLQLREENQRRESEKRLREEIRDSSPWQVGYFLCVDVARVLCEEQERDAFVSSVENWGAGLAGGCPRGRAFQELLSRDRVPLFFGVCL